MHHDDLEVRVSDGALWLTLNRPETLNALTAKMADELAEHLEAAASREDIRVVVLAGRGGAFSSGADLGGDNAHENFDRTSLDRANRIIRAITALPKPCVAAVNGVVAGVGFSAAVACDLVVAAESSTFVLAFARIGLMPDGGATALVTAATGRARAMRLALLAEPLSATDAHRYGLISHVVPDEEFDKAVDKLVSRLSSGPPLAYAATKGAINATALAHLDAALERETTGQILLLRTADVAEGMRAFAEGRRPRFEGE